MTPVDRLKWLAGVNGSGLPSCAVRVAVALADRANGDGESWPSEATLGRDAGGISRDTVRRGIAALVEADLLEVERNAVGDRPDKRTNLFRLAGVQNCDPAKLRRRKTAPSGGAKLQPKQLKENKTIKNPSSDSESDSSEPTDEQAKRVLAVYADTVKPPRLDTSRSRAKRHLEKLLRKHSVDDLLASVRNYAAECDAAGTEEKYRRGAGNFFGKDADFEQYMPGEYEPPLSEQDKKHAAFVEANFDEIMRIEEELAEGGDA